jgi:hypothetical protein
MSQTVTDMRSSFNGGEVSRRMEGRTDTAIYRIAAATIENIFLAVEGPLVKAPGFAYKRPAAMTAMWVSRFIFSRTQAYLLEWSNQRIRFYTNGGRIESDPVTPYEVVVPYAAAEAPAISRQQSYDRQYMAHRAYPPAALTRTAAEIFSYAVLVLANGPFEDGNIDKTIGITASATTGSVTLTAPSAIFAAGDIGGLFRLEALDFSDVTAWQVGIDGINIGDKRRSDGKVYVAQTSGRTGTIAPTHTDGSEWDGSTGTDVNGKGPYGVRWQYLYDRFGILKITAIGGGGLTCTADVLRTLPDSLTSVASWRWAFGAFSTKRGWPNVVVIWNQRMVLIKDFDVYGSVVGDYLNHATFTSSGQLAADLAFHYRLAASDPPLWAVADVRLVLGTASGIYPLGAVNAAAAAGPGNIGISRPSFYGVEPVQPLQIGTLTEFVQRGGRKLREGQYDFQRDALVASNTTVWARHITRGGIKQLSYLSADEELLFAVRGDGQLAVHAYAPEQDVKGWSRRIHGGGTFVSADTIPSEDGSQDELWALVDVGGVKSIEQMQPFWDEDVSLQADAFFVDSGATITFGSPSAHVSGATWLAGKAVSVLADGAKVPDITVAGDGSFDLPFAATKVTVGLPYTARLTSLRVEAETRSGTAQGKLKKLVNAILRLITTGTGLRAGTAGGELYDIIRRSPGDRMNAPIPLFTGDTDNISIGGSFDREGRFTIEHSDPTPLILTAVMPRFEVSEQ